MFVAYLVPKCNDANLVWEDGVGTMALGMTEAEARAAVRKQFELDMPCDTEAELVERELIWEDETRVHIAEFPGWKYVAK